MGEFRIGRSRAQHSYPEARRNTTVPYARNFASGPAADTPISTLGTQLVWSAVDVGVADEDVQITPQSTGIIRITGVVGVQNSAGAPRDIRINVQLDNVSTAVPAAEHVTVDPINAGESVDGFESIPILVEISGLVVGVPRNIQLLLTSLNTGVEIVALSSTIEVQEVPAASG